MDSFENDDVLEDAVELNSFGEHAFDEGTHELWANNSSTTSLSEVDLFDDTPRISLAKRFENCAKAQAAPFSQPVELYDSGRQNLRTETTKHAAPTTLEIYDSNTAREKNQTSTSEPVLQSQIELYDSKIHAANELRVDEQAVAACMKHALITADLCALRNTVEGYAASPQDLDPAVRALGKDLEGTGVKVRYAVNPSPNLPTVKDGSGPASYGTLVLYDREAVYLYTAYFGATRGNHSGSSQSVEAVLERLGNQVKNRITI